jgi:hypothetical protein
MGAFAQQSERFVDAVAEWRRFCTRTRTRYGIAVSQFRPEEGRP